MSDPSPASPDSIKNLIESLLFVADGAVAIDELARALEIDRGRVEQNLVVLAEEYRSRGFRMQRSHDQVQLVSAPEAAPAVAKFLGLESSTRLSGPSLETLAIVAYRQPVTRPQIEQIRGVNCDGVMHSLLLRELIQETGRLDTVGHPIQYGTTISFLQYFGLESLDELPPLPPDLEFEAEVADVADLLRGREAEGERG